MAAERKQKTKERSLKFTLFGTTGGLAMLCIVISMVVTYASSNIKKDTALITDSCVPIIGTIGEMNYDIMNLRLVMNLAVFLTDPAYQDNINQTKTAEFEAIRGQIGQLKEYVTVLDDKTLEASLDKLEANIKSIEDRAEVEAGLMKQGKNDEAYGDLVAAFEYFTDNEAVMAELKAAAFEKYTAAAVMSKNRVNSLSVLAGIAFVLAIIDSVVVITTVRGKVVLPLVKASTRLKEVVEKIETGNGDLTERIEVKRDDEIGRLGAGINTFIELLQNIMKTIKADAAELENSSVSNMNSLKNSNSNATSISAALQQLAASMEEITATTQQMVGDSKDVLQGAQDMNSKANEGAKLVDEIKNRAVQINSEIKTNKQTTETMVGNIGDALNKALEDSRSVNRISELTNDILDISSQTNLLALNASIEAARAGEAGKGFAVVAEEIRVLADSSRETANSIQEISHDVIEAVNKLSENAQEMIGFVDTSVMKDYEGFADFAERYNTDAEVMNDIFHQFETGTINMEKVIEGMSEGITAIATTVDESAMGVTSAAENSGELVNELSGVSSQVENNTKIAEELAQEVEKFSIL